MSYMNHEEPYSETYLQDILSSVKSIAMVGASGDKTKFSYGVLRVLHETGYDMIPVNPGLAGQEIRGLKVAELRDALLALKPLDLDHVKSINRAEAEFWRRSCGTHVGDSSTKLNFECGGQQWVRGRADSPSTRVGVGVASSNFERNRGNRPSSHTAVMGTGRSPRRHLCPCCGGNGDDILLGARRPRTRRRERERVALRVHAVRARVLLVRTLEGAVLRACLRVPV